MNSSDSQKSKMESDLNGYSVDDNLFDYTPLIMEPIRRTKSFIALNIHNDWDISPSHELLRSISLIDVNSIKKAKPPQLPWFEDVGLQVTMEDISDADDSSQSRESDDTLNFRRMHLLRFLEDAGNQHGMAPPNHRDELRLYDDHQAPDDLLYKPPQKKKKPSSAKKGTIQYYTLAQPRYHARHLHTTMSKASQTPAPEQWNTHLYLAELESYIHCLLGLVKPRAMNEMERKEKRQKLKTTNRLMRYRKKRRNRRHSGNSRRNRRTRRNSRRRNSRSNAAKRRRKQQSNKRNERNKRKQRNKREQRKNRNQCNPYANRRQSPLNMFLRGPQRLLAAVGWAVYIVWLNVMIIILQLLCWKGWKIIIFIGLLLFNLLLFH